MGSSSSNDVEIEEVLGYTSEWLEKLLQVFFESFFEFFFDI